jgi:hypothetical protein
MARRALGRAQGVGHMIPLDHRSLECAFAARTDAAARRWLRHACEEVRRDPGAIAAIFPAAARAVGKAPLDPRAPTGDVHAWTADAAARALLLVALGPAADAQLTPLYRHGDTAERCAILRALAFLSVEDGVGIPLVEDALRTNDSHLIAASLGPYALARLTDAALAHAVLKCVFVGISLAGLAGVERRATPAMAGMLARYAHERVAAGRAVPDDVWPLIDRFPPSRELAAIEAELSHPQAGRRRAAQGALAGRAAQSAPAAWGALAGRAAATAQES